MTPLVFGYGTDLCSDIIAIARVRIPVNLVLRYQREEKTAYRHLSQAS